MLFINCLESFRIIHKLKTVMFYVSALLRGFSTILRLCVYTEEGENSKCAGDPSHRLHYLPHSCRSIPGGQYRLFLFR